MNADDRIIRLIRPEYLEQTPSFLRRHAVENTCRMVARNHPEQYAVFSDAAEPDDAAKSQMSALVNSIYLDRLSRRRPM